MKKVWKEYGPALVFGLWGSFGARALGLKQSGPMAASLFIFAFGCLLIGFWWASRRET